MKRRFKGEYEVDPPSTGGPAQMEEVEREREREREREFTSRTTMRNTRKQAQESIIK
jgi:hypothetical protein